MAKKQKKKTVKKKQPARRAKAPAVSVAKVTPSRDGLRWTVVLSDGTRQAVSAAAAQSVGVAVGGPWSKSIAAKVANAEQDQALFQRAMAALAKRGRMDAPKLQKLLGADARAKRTVAALKRNGWIG